MEVLAPAHLRAVVEAYRRSNFAALSSRLLARRCRSEAVTEAQERLCRSQDMRVPRIRAARVLLGDSVKIVRGGLNARVTGSTSSRMLSR